MEQLILALAMHAGIHHDALGNYEGGQREAHGPRAELVLDGRLRFAGISVVGAWSHNRDYDPTVDTLHDPEFYELRATHVAGGLRAYLHYRGRLWVGLGLMYDRCSTTYIGRVQGVQEESRGDLFVEPFVGGSVLAFGDFDVTATATYATWDAPMAPFTEDMWSLMVGVAWTIRRPPATN